EDSVCSVTVLENRTPRAVRTTSISITRKSDAYVNAARTPEPLTAITNRSESSADGSVLPPTTPRIGTMKHDIPHRWKTFLVLKQARCLACYEGLPRVRHAMKCTECGLMAHRVCTSNVSNTCGLPEQCADYYVDSYTCASAGSMSGWMKIWRYFAFVFDSLRFYFRLGSFFIW
ncbi:Citron Rho-interacting kinase, partial [Toxocara canis]